MILGPLIDDDTAVLHQTAGPALEFTGQVLPFGQPGLQAIQEIVEEAPAGRLRLIAAGQSMGLGL